MENSTVSAAIPAPPRVCAACGKDRKGYNLEYDPMTMKGYCKNIYVCSDEHPNSPKNLMQRGNQIHLTTLEEATEAYSNRLATQYGNQDIVLAVRRLLASPITIRIMDTKQAEFIAKLALETGSNTEAIRMCIQDKMERTVIAVDQPLASNEEVKPEKLDVIIELEPEHKEPEQSKEEEWEV